MPEFILNRDYRLISLTGHVVQFSKGRAVNVPNAVVKEAVAIGAEPVDGHIDVLDPEAEPVIQYTAEERKDKIFKAFDTLVNRNNRGDFTGQGLPHLGALNKLLVDIEIDGGERDLLWREYSEGSE